MGRRVISSFQFSARNKRICSLLISICLFLIVSYPLRSLAADNDANIKLAKQEDSVQYAIAVDFVPVMNNSDLTRIFGGTDGTQLSLDDCGMMRELEFVALPGTVFKIEESLKKDEVLVYRVSTADYPYETRTGYYIDRRLVETKHSEPPKPERKLPKFEVIQANLLQAEGSRYIWGGNHSAGISRLLSLYPPSPIILRNWEMIDRWMLRGVDCSGLLYQATNGYTPRNTSSLVNYGMPVNITGHSAEDISRKLKPLDLIVWNGHVIIVLDSTHTIESRLYCPSGKGGVVVTSLKERLSEIMREREPTNDPALAIDKSRKKFVIRRWYSY